MSGKNKSPISAKKLFGQNRKLLSREKMRNLIIIPWVLLPVHRHLQGLKEAEKEVVQTLHLKIRVITEGFPFQPWLGLSLKVPPPRTRCNNQIKRKSRRRFQKKYVHHIKVFIWFLAGYFYNFLMKAYWIHSSVFSNKKLFSSKQLI